MGEINDVRVMGTGGMGSKGLLGFEGLDWGVIEMMWPACEEQVGCGKFRGCTGLLKWD